jgi:hypothetical protein
MKMEWISIRDRLPEPGLKVLAFNNSKEFEENGPYFVITFYDKWYVDNDTYPNSSNYLGFMPTHWMPLPNPPKGV